MTTLAARPLNFRAPIAGEPGWIARDSLKGKTIREHVVVTDTGFSWDEHPEGGYCAPISADRWDAAMEFAQNS